MSETYKSRVYTDRPAYADFDPPAKFETIKSIIAKRLTQYPNAICSYSGGSDSDHVKATAEKYDVEIQEFRPKIGIVKSARIHGIPFISKIMSAGLRDWQIKEIPLTIAEEYDQAEDKAAKRKELKERYPKCESVINFLCCCNSAGEPRPNALSAEKR